MNLVEVAKATIAMMEDGRRESAANQDGTLVLIAETVERAAG
jgi:hypothetical protein